MSFIDPPGSATPAVGMTTQGAGSSHMAPGYVNVCREKLRLLTAYNWAAVTHSDWITAWLNRIEAGAKAETSVLQRVSGSAHRTAAAAREQLERHVAEHGCGPI